MDVTSDSGEKPACDLMYVYLVNLTVYMKRNQSDICIITLNIVRSQVEKPAVICFLNILVYRKRRQPVGCCTTCEYYQCTWRAANLLAVVQLVNITSVQEEQPTCWLLYNWWILLVYRKRSQPVSCCTTGEYYWCTGREANLLAVVQLVNITSVQEEKPTC